MKKDVTYNTYITEDQNASVICVDHFWVIVAPTVSYAAPWSSKLRQCEGFSVFILLPQAHSVFKPSSY